MKLWLSGLALLAVASTAQAENFRIVQSPAQKLDIWIDNIKDNTPQSWCKSEIALRIVANGNKDVSVLENFVPRLGSLLEHQCSKVNKLSWALNDPAGTTLAQGTADKAQEWKLVVKQQQTAPAATQTSGALLPPDQNSEINTVAADRTPWQEFTLQDGCHLRTFWEGGSSAPALFIPDSDTTRCGNGSWLSGHTVISQTRSGGQKEIAVTYIHGFPVMGLNQSVDPEHALITSVNKERMVFSTPNSDQSWMILPYDSALNGWKSNGTVAVEISRETASDDAKLQARIAAVKKVWSAWVTPGTTLNIVLIDTLRPQLRDPAVGAWRAAN
ncbi:hypothetical protein YA49_00395 [Enterobacter cloacae subsp. cloacae]|uniref:hypothetical protein n=1 Tax=Enterobacter cloacae TaxID=550 RepID=UPI00063B05CE|nr:hypothetical protein [Enterobacter cloacae]KLG14373.1 hypothetical protein YA49_00395 [Enterobacter cloacae subsp. cloacae]KTI70390.1 hypothetical protein ASV00_00250 [Enterobacter cloacae subsp. cloacae]KVI68487.1 hypothetical protein AWS52_05805 [Enterobacter cloacae subsp. cloacae]RTO16889.1 hypothetical protein EKN72_08390 [Enterobacter cloacae]RTO65975.1 hypothetical protein EKN66_09460 [Enterobacter cloacae]